MRVLDEIKLGLEHAIEFKRRADIMTSVAEALRKTEKQFLEK